MNSLYNNLKNYNETFSNPYDSLTLYENTEVRCFPINSSNRWTIYQGILEGYHCVPKIETESSGLFSLLLDNEKNGFSFYFIVRKLVGFQSLHMYSLNEKQERDQLLFTIESNQYVEPSLKISGILLQGFVECSLSSTTSMDELYNLLQSKNVVLSVNTASHPDGLICGVMTPMSLFQSMM